MEGETNKKTQGIKKKKQSFSRAVTIMVLTKLLNCCFLSAKYKVTVVEYSSGCIRFWKVNPTTAKKPIVTFIECVYSCCWLNLCLKSKSSTSSLDIWQCHFYCTQRWQHTWNVSSKVTLYSHSQSSQCLFMIVSIFWQACFQLGSYTIYAAFHSFAHSDKRAQHLHTHTQMQQEHKHTVHLFIYCACKHTVMTNVLLYVSLHDQAHR